MLRFREEGMTTFSVGPEEGKVYASKRGYPCKADRAIDNVCSKVHTTHMLYQPTQHYFHIYRILMC